MRYAITSMLFAFCLCAVVEGGRAVTPIVQPHYRLGKAPRAEFKVGGKSYQIDPQARMTKQVRELSSEDFNPITRRERVESFYRASLKDIDRDHDRLIHDCGPFRREFIIWTHGWSAVDRARWAWNNRVYFDDELWNQWMADAAFAAEIAQLQHSNEPQVAGYIPSQYATTSPVMVYNDQYLEAAYNPAPFLAVLSLKSLKPGAETDWIGKAATDSLLSKLSSTPGMYVTDREQVASALNGQKLPTSATTQPDVATQVGKALDVEQVVEGSYVVDGNSVLFNIRIVDVHTGAVHDGISKTLPRDHLLDQIPDLGSGLVAALGYPTEDQSSADALAGSNDPTPAFVVTGEKFQIAALDNGAKAFSNRNYVWQNVPNKLRGWRETQDAGGVRAVIKVQASRDTTLYAATATVIPGVDTTGWTEVPDLSFAYTDAHQTRMTVFEKHLSAGDSISIPQGNWSGMILLMPPSP